MVLKHFVLSALKEHNGKPVVVPVIVRWTMLSSDVVDWVKSQMPQKEKKPVFLYRKAPTGEMIEQALTLKVRTVLGKLAKEGLAKRINLIKIRDNRTPAEYREAMKEMGLVFSEPRQLEFCQGAYQITERGLKKQK